LDKIIFAVEETEGMEFICPVSLKLFSAAGLEKLIVGMVSFSENELKEKLISLVDAMRKTNEKKLNKKIDFFLMLTPFSFGD
jgi:hypothetical protein